MKTSLKTLFILAPLMISCAHKGLDRKLADSRLDSLRHESLTRYSSVDLKKFSGIEKNIALCHDGRYNEALTAFKDVLDKNRKNPVYWNHLGTCYYLKGEYPKSLIYLDISKGLTKNKKLHAAIENNIGLNHLGQKNYLEAKEAFKKSIELDSTALTPRYNLAQLYLAKGLYGKAREMLKTLEKTNPKDVDVNYSLAHLRLMQNDYNGSLAYFKRIPSAYLKRDDVALNLATAYYFLGENDKALKALDEAPMNVARFAIQQTELKKRIERKISN